MKAKYNSLRTSIFFSALLLSVGAASAQNVGHCSTANAAGGWGYTVSGQNTSLGSDAIVGSGTMDATGKVNLTLNEVTNGIYQVGTLTTGIGNNVTVNPDCTATLVLKVSEAPPPATPKLVATATWVLVFVDNQTEIRGILTKLVLPDGTNAPLPVQTLNAKKLFPNGGNQQ